MAGRPSVYTISPDVPFLGVLADRVAQIAGAQIGEAVVLLPTRRACRAFAETFLRQSGLGATILPRLRPIGDVDEPSLDLADEEYAHEAALDLPPAMPVLRRELLLARLIRAEAEARRSAIDAAQAAALARALGRLIDEVATERVSFERLANLVPENFAAHWQLTLDFLRIVTEHWPRVLDEVGCIDAIERRNRLIEAQRNAWRRTPPETLVVAAGSTGSVPATGDLLATIARLPNGLVVLPGLDLKIDEERLEDYGPTHPQYAMLRLLRRLEIRPSEVVDWVSEREPPRRFLLAAAALRPAATELPQTPRFNREDIADVRRIDCPGPQEEAGVIALMMRHALETPNKTAALVTPDRTLARRVVAELARWKIAIDDSAGVPLGETPPGLFLRLIATAAGEQAAPAAFLALLKHPLAAGGTSPARFRAFARRLEIAALRGPRPAPGIEGLRSALAASSAGADLVNDFESLARKFAPLLTALAAPGIAVESILARHLEFAEALSATEEVPGADILWRGDAGEATAQFVYDLDRAAADFAPIAGTEYVALFDSLIAGTTVRPRYGLHPRLHIWGLLEARLQRADLLILGGLNEGTWPPDPAADPWMSRPMRAKFGLPPVERRIGLTAHDFVQAFCAPEIAITRATRVDGTPTVPSRWLDRLEALLPDLGPSQEASWWLGLQARLDAPGRDEVRSISAPAPRPPVSARPRRLSVTQIEAWMRDPYAIFARHILGLTALEPIAMDPTAATRGIILHRAFDLFLRENTGALPAEALARLFDCGRRAFAEQAAPPSVVAVWWPRFVRAAEWFIDTEREHREAITTINSEVKGTIELGGLGGRFELTAKADRVDLRRDRSIAIVDFKTGGVPSAKEIVLGLAPQLALEALIAAAGGFTDVPAGAVSELAFWRVTGGREAGKVINAPGDVQALVDGARSGLTALIEAFDSADTPYLSVPNRRFAPRYSDYDHLARIAEWSVAGGDDA